MVDRTAERVRKRDGHEESLDMLRLTASVEAALRVAGEHEAAARQFVPLVMLHTRGPEGVVRTVDLAAAVDAVLRDFGSVDAAQAYRARRVAEERACAALRVHVAAPGGPRSAKWDRGRLQLALQRDRYFERSVAREVARRVERRLTSMGQRHVTARLVAALADNECRVLGLASAAIGAERIGPERRHLRAWLGGDCVPAGGLHGMPEMGPESGDVRPALGEALLASFAVEELLPANAATALSAGRFEPFAGGDWLRPLVARLHPEPGETEDAFWKRVAAASARARELQVLVPSGLAGEVSRLAPRWLLHGGARLRLTTLDLALARDWAADDLWHALPIARWNAAGDAERAELASGARTLLLWQPPKRLPPQAERRHGEIHSGAAVNLARAASAAGPWGEREFLADVEDAVACACAGLEVLARRACSGVRPRVALLPAGLPQALALLFPDPELRDSRTRMLMLSLRDLFERVPRRMELRLDDGRPPRAEGVGTRLADRDGVPGDATYPLGWLPGPPAARALRSALVAAPWLELSAADAHGAPWADLLVPRSAARET